MKLLVIRTSAMGDVALTTPVLRGMRKQYPDVEVVLLTRSSFKPFFSSMEGVRLFFPDFKKRHKGLMGLVNLYKDINRLGQFDYIIDLHDVLRSKILRFFFSLSGVPAAVIDKGRSEKKNLIKGKNRKQLKHSVERYCDVFFRAGFSVIPENAPSIVPSEEAMATATGLISKTDELNIGIAPYARHKLKMWPEEYMVRLLGLISEKHKTRFWLFGGNDEYERIAVLQSKVPGSINMTGKLNLDEELALMSRLDLMIAMDSSNMHMAALTGTKVISIWGGTDLLSGFGAWMQPENYSVSIGIDKLSCRPCTTYGKGDCRRGDLACMKWLTPEMVFQRLIELELF
jgi:ADP-heptose:LPS heptosyltransferase